MKNTEDRAGYKAAGIDITETDDAKRQMAAFVTSEATPLNKFGAFASLVSLELRHFVEPVLVMKTEEPGSKQLLAFQHDRVESVCEDMINHLVNDCIVMGATPLAVQDAVICGSFDKARVVRMVKAMADACRRNDCTLVGGETSVQPGVIPPGVFILTSCIVGLVERARIIDGSAISPGDVVVALASNGFHTNGYTLVRHLMERHEELRTPGFIDQALAVHTPYYPALKPLIADGIPSGMAHITGGGIRDNLRRILPSGVNAVVDLSRFRIPEVFRTVRRAGGLDDSEMLRTFNCGVGMALVVPSRNTQDALRRLGQAGLEAYEIGDVAQGDGNVVLNGSLRW